MPETARIVAFVMTQYLLKRTEICHQADEFPWFEPVLLCFISWAAVIRAALCRGWFWQTRSAPQLPSRFGAPARKDCQAGVWPRVGALTLPSSAFLSIGSHKRQVLLLIHRFAALLPHMLTLKPTVVTVIPESVLPRARVGAFLRLTAQRHLSC